MPAPPPSLRHHQQRERQWDIEGWVMVEWRYGGRGHGELSRTLTDKLPDYQVLYLIYRYLC